MLKKQCSSKITNPIIDKYYEQALKAGALGGKLLGAGGGGFLLLYVPIEKQSNVVKACSDMKAVPFLMESKGSSVIFKH